MRKSLLTLAALAITASASWADQTTLVFDGDNEMCGLPRLTKLPTAADLVKEISYEQDGVDFNIKVTNADSGNFGYAFIYNATTIDQRGIALFQNTTSDLTLSVPGGKITGVTIYMSGGAIGLLTPCIINGKKFSEPSGSEDINPDVKNKKKYFYTWSDAEGVESVVINPEAYKFGNSRCIRSIDVTYSPALGDKSEAGLAFKSEAIQAIAGQSFTAPALDNPNNLPITWSSSDENIAAVNANGVVSLTGTPGTVTITAATEGDATHAQGKASYIINVIGSANNIEDFFKYAPSNNDKVYIDFPLTVTFASGVSVFLADADGKGLKYYDAAAAAAQRATSQKVGNVIPAGWIAQRSADNGGCIIGTLPSVKETVEVVYPVVESINYTNDANRVVTLKGVTFTSNTPAGDDPVNGSTANGAYQFRNTFGASSYPPGIYDVTVVVSHAVVNTTTMNWLAPIAYEGIPTKLKVSTDYAPVKNGMADKELMDLLVVNSMDVEEDDGEMSYDIIISGKANVDEIRVTIQPMSGTAGYLGSINGIGGSPLLAKAANADAEEGAPLMGSTFTFKVDGNGYVGSFVPYTLVDGEPEYNTEVFVNVAFNVERIYTFPSALVVKAPENPNISDDDDETVLPITVANDDVSGSNESLVNKLFPGMAENLTDMGAKYYFAAKGVTALDWGELSIEIPAGFDGFIYRTMEMPSIGEASDGRRKVQEVAFTPDNDFEDFDSYSKYVKGDLLKYIPNGKTYITEMFLYKGEEVASNYPIYCLASFVTTDGPAGPPVPAQISVSANPEKGVEIANNDLEKADELFPGIADGMEDYYVIIAKGEIANDKLTLTLDVPEGFDGYLYDTQEAGIAMAPRKANKYVSMTDFEDQEGDFYKKGNVFEYDANGSMFMTQAFLYSGDLVANENPFMIMVNVTKTPEFPEEFNVAVSDENIEVAQELDGEDFYIFLSGETTEDTVTVTVDVPEGWDGFYSAVWGEEEGDGGATPYARAKAASVDTSDEDMWMPAEALTEMMPLKDTNSLTFTVGAPNAMGIMFLYKGDKVLYLPINVMPSITKVEAPALPDFPDAFGITLSDDKKITISQESLDFDYFVIKINGVSEAETITATFEVPEGWDGFYGITSNEMNPGGINPLKAPAVADEEMWIPTDMIDQFLPGIKQTNALTFEVSDEPQSGMLFLYKDDMVYMAQIVIDFEVDKDLSGVDAIEAVDADARYFNLQGVEVKNPENGIYVKVANGKVSKVNVK